jgi:N-acyl-D-aspartate/D-glutamate deacylase
MLSGGAVRYDHSPDDSLAAEAKRRGVSPAVAYIDLCLESDGAIVLETPFLNDSIDAIADMLRNPTNVLGIGDAGAHVAQIMDASQSTWLLAYWVREQHLCPIEAAIRRLTSEPAQLFGIHDRGEIRVGAHADVNVIDFDRLALLTPEFVNDLPLAAGRFIQRATGYDATIANGEVVMREGAHTGALPGQLVVAQRETR